MEHKQCRTCGHITRDWSKEGVVLDDTGHHKGWQLPTKEDRSLPYRNWRRKLTFPGAVTDIDQVEWRYRADGSSCAVALLEITRVDGNERVPPSYFQNILLRMYQRDGQASLAISAAESFDTDCWVVAWRENLEDFWVYPLRGAHNREWRHMNKGQYALWLAEL